MVGSKILSTYSMTVTEKFRTLPQPITRFGSRWEGLRQHVKGGSRPTWSHGKCMLPWKRRHVVTRSTKTISYLSVHFQLFDLAFTFIKSAARSNPSSASTSEDCLLLKATESQQQYPNDSTILSLHTGTPSERSSPPPLSSSKIP